MKVLKVLLYVVLGLVALFVALGLFGKKDYHIERSIEIDAPKNLIYEYVRYFKNGDAWSPWAHLDPNMKQEITGNDGNVGATHKWSGNDDVGEGQQTITAMTPERIDIRVKFIRPFESESPTYMTFQEQEKTTKVTWAFDMHVAFPWNGLAMFTDMDAGVGGDYARGLQNLKKNCEEIAHKKYNGYEVAEQEIPVQYYAGVRKTVNIPEVEAFYGANLPKVIEQVQKSGAAAGVPSGLYWTFDQQAGKTDMAVAVPMPEDKKLGSGFGVFPVGGHKAAVIEYMGSYDKIGDAHMAMDEYMKEKGLESILPVVEEYVAGPGREPDTTKWLTRVIYFVQPKPAN